MVKFTDAQTGTVIETDRPSRIRAYRRHPLRWLEVPDVGVPDGTVAEVLEWVGDDPARRQAARFAELAGKRRKGVLDAL